MDAADLPRLIEALRNPRVYPHPAQRVDHIETHISHVMLAGAFAYKLKKPVSLGFLDFSTEALRRHFCKEEIRLNRRLASRLYVGLVPITGTADAPMVGGDGPVLEYAVTMHRFPQDALLDRCRLTPEVIDRLAERVAAFHHEIPPALADSPYGTPEAVLAPMQENLRQVRAQVRDPDQSERLEHIAAWTLERWSALTPLIQARRARGHVRECHGDMHRGNIALVDDEPLIFDALEFSPNLRWIDTASELAFLIMDIEEAGETAMARRLLNRYLEIGGDYGAVELLDFYKVYRAMVRAKVLAIRLAQTQSCAAAGADARRGCVRYLELAERYTRARRPRLIIACGLSGSGKSRLGRRLREALPLIHLRSDIERKRLFGLDPNARTAAQPETGIYFPQATDWTYGRLARIAGRILNAGYDVLVDATFLTAARRQTFRELAAERGAAFVVLAMHAPVEVLRERVVRRLAEARDASEATLSVLERQIAAHEPLGSQERSMAVEIDSSSPPELETVLAGIERVSGIRRTDQ